ncbi:unnamed protein product, partial [Prorocentrum cordatum]
MFFTTWALEIASSEEKKRELIPAPIDVHTLQEVLEFGQACKLEGNAKFREGLYEEALFDYSRGDEELRKWRVEAHLRNERKWLQDEQLACLKNKAQAALRLELFQTALEAAEAALKIDDEDHKAWYRKVQAEKGLGRLREAEESLRRLEDVAQWCPDRQAAGRGRRSTGSAGAAGAAGPAGPEVEPPPAAGEGAALPGPRRDSAGSAGSAGSVGSAGSGPAQMFSRPRVSNPLELLRRALLQEGASRGRVGTSARTSLDTDPGAAAAAAAFGWDRATSQSSAGSAEEARSLHTVRDLRASWFVRILKVYHAWAFVMAIPIIVGMAASTFLSLFLQLTQEMEKRRQGQEVPLLKVDHWAIVLATFANTLLYCLMFVSCALRAVWLIKDCLKDDMFIDYRRTLCCEGAGPGSFPPLRTNHVSVNSDAERQKIHRAVADDGTLMDDISLKRGACRGSELLLSRGSKLLLEGSMADKEHRDHILELELDPPATLVFRVTARPAAFRGEHCGGLMRAVVDVLWQCCIYLTLDVLPVLWALFGSAGTLGADDGGPAGRFVDAAVLVACAHTVFYFCWSTAMDYFFKALVLGNLLFHQRGCWARCWARMLGSSVDRPPISQSLRGSSPGEASLQLRPRGPSGSTGSPGTSPPASRRGSLAAPSPRAMQNRSDRLYFLGQAREVLGACPEQALAAARRPPGREDELNISEEGPSRQQAAFEQGRTAAFLFALWLAFALWASFLLRYRLGGWCHSLTVSILGDSGRSGSEHDDQASFSFGRPFGAASSHWSLCFLIHCGVLPTRILWKSAVIVALSLGAFAIGTTVLIRIVASLVGIWAVVVGSVAYYRTDDLWKVMLLNLLGLAVLALAAMGHLQGRVGVLRTACLILVTQMGAWRERGHQAHRFLMALFFVLLVGIASATLCAVAAVPGKTLPGRPVGRAGREFKFPLLPEAVSTGYAFCGLSWPMAPDDIVSTRCNDNRLSLVDFAHMSRIAYKNQSETEEELERILPGWTVNQTEQKDFKGVSFMHLTKGRTHVVAVRGTKTLYDVLQDLNIWLPAVSLQLADLVGPHVPDSMSRILEAVTGLAAWLEPLGGDRDRSHMGAGRQPVPLVEYVRELKRRVRGEGGEGALYVVGHSLGGGFAQLVGALENVTAVTFSAPGLYATERIFWSPPGLSRLRHSGVNVVPDGDPVPKVDSQVGTVLKIDCDGSAMSCHSILSTLCELSATCGNAGGRPTPRNYTFWCSECEPTRQSRSVGPSAPVDEDTAGRDPARSQREKTDHRRPAMSDLAGLMDALEALEIQEDGTCVLDRQHGPRSRRSGSKETATEKRRPAELDSVVDAPVPVRPSEPGALVDAHGLPQ